ncbi:rhodopsin, GQ-coupled isoform X1 [Nasonia vitripennis]|uniref:G-protein coupled receptors family 1 profile domain-containing protein n=1 Tax=Nasonia vitripennis TaxID=7425 RepID=A0A7M7H3D4_NASVI|nr:rhodopsin, GQ-coupled isoform X1 [Nasonia vitripennis]
MENLSTINLTSALVNSSVAMPAPEEKRFLSFIVLNVVCIVGILGNLSALFILLHKDKRRNRKHLLMLRCLTINDLVAITGTYAQMFVSRYVGLHKFCYLHVVWRLFGLFSGCVAIVMAVERWIALTRPFVYQKQVTYPMIVRCMLLLWVVALTLTFPPFFGFGLYEGHSKKGYECMRYRDATQPMDVAYAYVWFFFGTLLCLSIVWCNLAVASALKRLGRRNGALRRISRASSRAKPLLTVAGPPTEVGITAEERAFAKLMAMLSISFLICWMPQMIAIPLSQYQHILPERSFGNKMINIFKKIADVLLGIHFTLDPYIYVLLRMPRPRFPLLKPLCRICWPARSRASSFTGTTEQHGSSGDPPTPITEAPSTPVSEERDSQLVAVAV